MKNSKANIIFIFLVIFANSGSTQVLNSEISLKSDKTKKEWEISFFAGRSFFGPANEIKEAVVAETIHPK